jgi:hypothetical protein
MRLHFPATISGMSTGYDHRAEAEAAMQMAVAATCEHDRLKWVRVASAWQDLARFHAEGRIDRRYPEPSLGRT